MIRRPAVVRSNSIISARPVGRSSGAKIFCDINPDGNYGIDTIHIEACQFELLVDANYGRTFFSATVSHLRAYDEGSGLEWGTAHLGIQVGGWAVIPWAYEQIPFGGDSYRTASVTGALDLPAGHHDVALVVGANDYSTTVSYGQASLQAICGQQVAEQECWYQGACI